MGKLKQRNKLAKLIYSVPWRPTRYGGTEFTHDESTVQLAADHIKLGNRCNTIPH